MIFVNRFYWIRERKKYLAKINNLPNHPAPLAAPRRGAQCSCIGLRPALRTTTNIPRTCTSAMEQKYLESQFK